MCFLGTSCLERYFGKITRFFCCIKGVYLCCLDAGTRENNNMKKHGFIAKVTNKKLTLSRQQLCETSRFPSKKTNKQHAQNIIYNTNQKKARICIPKKSNFFCSCFFLLCCLPGNTQTNKQ